MFPSPLVRIVGFLSASLITLVLFQAVAMIGLPATTSAVVPSASAAAARPGQAASRPGSQPVLAAAPGATVQ